MNLNIIRIELKYYVSYPDYLNLSKKLSMIMKKDQHDIDKGYFIRSLYFDTINNKAFYEKMEGIEERKKYRLRIYDTKDKNVKFEIKKRINNQMLKETAVITKEDALEIQSQNYDVLIKYNNPILNKIYCEFKQEKFIPVVIVDYLRDAYVYDLNNIRITFDKSLKSDVSNLNLFENNISGPLLNENVVIMEIKYNHFLPEHIKKTLQISRFEREAISKYCISRIRHGGRL